MCTVTYFPRPSGFILTHNRDEAPSRTTQTIVREKMPGGDILLFPRDGLAGGTWIATSGFGRAACLLNGAFVLHKRELPYRRSRGLILLDFFDWENPDDFFQNYDFDQIEPFTFLFFDRPKASELSEGSLQITELRWDGQQRHLKNLSPTEPHFWCSATLYPPEIQVRREQVFTNWLANFTHNNQGQGELQSPNHQLNKSPNHQLNKSPNHQLNKSPLKQITQLHQTGSVNDPENDYVMNRAGRVQTVSITQVIVDEKNAQMRHLDLLGGKRSKRRLTYRQRAAFTVNR